jgi:hypothetical protein
MLAALAPWSIARSRAAPRRVLLLLMLGALLYGLGMQAARACLPIIAAYEHAEVLSRGDAPDHCHGDEALALAVCESHCRTDVQSNRASLNFDLPAAVPLDGAAALAPTVTVAASDGAMPPSRDRGPPLHLLFHRFLR